MLSHVCAPLPATIIKSIDTFSDKNLSGGFKLAEKLGQFAPLLSAFESKRISWLNIYTPLEEDASSVDTDFEDN
jgi:hypothetical protein